jgi:hypothetical protein
MGADRVIRPALGPSGVESAGSDSGDPQSLGPLQLAEMPAPSPDSGTREGGTTPQHCIRDMVRDPKAIWIPPN